MKTEEYIQLLQRLREGKVIVWMHLWFGLI